MTFKSSEVSNFPQLDCQQCVFRNIRDHPHTAEMYICNLFVAYFVFSPVNANRAIFLNFFLFLVLILWTTMYIFMAFGLI